MRGFLSGKLAKGYDHAENFYKRGLTPFATNAVSIVHAPQGSGKSYAVAKLCGHEADMTNVAYLDFDQNSRTFANFCLSNGVEYVNMDNVPSQALRGKGSIKANKQSNEAFPWPTELPMELKSVCMVLSKDDTVIIDSLSSMVPDIDAMSTQVSKVFYSLASVAKYYKITIIVIDHSTEIRNKDGKVVDFKIEGSKSGKLKATASAIRYEADDKTKLENGGTFTVERSRIEELRIGDTLSIHRTKTIDDALEAIQAMGIWTDVAAGIPITAKQFGVATKNSRDKWIRDFKLNLFEEDIIERTTYLVFRTIIEPTAEEPNTFAMFDNTMGEAS